MVVKRISSYRSLGTFLYSLELQLNLWKETKFILKSIEFDGSFLFLPASGQVRFLAGIIRVNKILK